jgi:Cupin-like domain
MSNSLNTAVSPLGKNWQGWIAENLILGVPREQLVDQMVASGFKHKPAVQLVAEQESSPAIETARALLDHQRKQGAVFEAMAEIARQSRYGHGMIKRALAAADFYEQYFWRNTPVVLQGLMSDWPAVHKWNLEFFAQHYGGEIVEITADREGDSLYEDNFERHRARITMRDYVRKLDECRRATNDLYLVAKNNLLSKEPFHGLFADIRCPFGFLNETTLSSRNVKLWMGPAGTVTPLHHDGTNILFAQVGGRKQIKLISPFFLNYLYNDRLCFSQVDLNEIDYERFPLMKEVEIVDVVVDAGEALFIPIGWWHWVKSLEFSISLSFNNFLFNAQPIILKDKAVFHMNKVPPSPGRAR